MNNEEYKDIEMQLDGMLPHGSGIDCTWMYTWKKKTLLCENSIHVMDNSGFYRGFIPFTVKIPLVKGMLECHNFTVIYHNWKSYFTKKYVPIYKEYIEDAICHSLPIRILTSDCNLLKQLTGAKMKFKTTQKFIKNSHVATIKVGYCHLYYLLSHKDPIAYTTRIEGWASDVYSINGVAISTGYKAFGQSVDYSIVKKYEDKATEVRNDDSLSYEKKGELLDALIDHFLLKVTGRV